MKEDDLQTLHDKICGKREDDFFGEEELQDMHDAIWENIFERQKGLTNCHKDENDKPC